MSELFYRKAVYSTEKISEAFDKIENDVLFFELIQDNAFLERVLISSYSLYQGIVRAIKKEEFSNGLKESVLLYYLRMLSRPIPFGLNASVGYLTDKSHEVKKSVRISNYWLEILQHKIESSLTTDSIVKVKRSDFLKVVDNELFLYKHLENKEITKKIVVNSLVLDLFNETKRAISIKFLIKKMMKKYDDKDEILSTIIFLIQNDFFITDLKLHTFNFGKEALNKFIDNIRDTRLLKEVLSIKYKIEKYEQLPIGEGIDEYIELIKLMRSIHSSQSYLVVDLINNENKDQTSLNQEMLSFKEKVKDLYILQNLDERVLYFENYKLKFLEKYGLLNEVPLLELIDEDFGLGLPEDRADKEFFILKNNYNILIDKIDNYLLNKWESNNLDTIILTKNDLINIASIIKSYLNPKRESVGYDIKFKKARGYEWDYIIEEDSFTSAPYSLTGRFSIDGSKKKIPEDFVPSSILSNQYSDLGVSNNPFKKKIEIDCITNKNDVNIQDIVVGLDDELLYLKDIKNQKRITPIRSNMLYYNYLNEYKCIKFLNLYSETQLERPKSLNFSEKLKLNYLPRITYENMVLAVRKWYVSGKRIKDFSGSFNKKLLNDYLNFIGVDPIVELCIGDKNLILDINKDFSINIILKELNKLGEVWLYEVLTKNIGEEFILPVHNYKIINEKSFNDNLIHEEVIDHNYTYFKIYYLKNKKIETIILLEKMLSKLNLESFFLVNYRDEKSHLRLRIRELSDENFLILFKYMNKLSLERKIVNFKIELFYPEINRYGGSNIYKEVYKYFEEDTLYYLYLLKNGLYQNYKEEITSTFIIIRFLKQFFSSYNEAFKFLERIVSNHKNSDILKDFKKNKQTYKSEVYKLLNSEYNTMHKENNTIDKIKNSFTNTNHKEYILKSILHMIINRHFNPTREIENHFYERSKYTLYNLNYYLKEEW